MMTPTRQRTVTWRDVARALWGCATFAAGYLLGMIISLPALPYMVFIHHRQRRSRAREQGSANVVICSKDEADPARGISKV